MNRSTDTRGGPRPQLVIVRGGLGDGPDALPDRAARGQEQTGRAAGGSSERDGTTAPPSSQEAELRAELRERTADLQRLVAEYDNYRKRIRRERLAVRQIAVANVLSRLLPVLDALTEARAQGEVTGGFQRVAQALETELTALGLESFGTAGEPFDPRVHDAVSYAYEPAEMRTPTDAGAAADAYRPPGTRPPADTSTPSDQGGRPACTAILRLGYRVGDQLLRPAQVAVTESARPTPRATDGHDASGDHEAQLP
ncbi:nucleotide exchange factor GrpE [Streptomyces sp. NPDC050636]|uniref:nucleotide exchange factor GrpE n=1 Tax=Streptomyces sp. NPDC050636 TaxID=3154510 RepID=UPI003412B3DD